METPCIIPYAPRPLQWRFHQQRTRFCVLLCHRRFGKTVAAVNDLLRAALRTSRTDWRAAYAAPYLGQAKAVAWDYLRHFAGVIPGTRFHEGELRCDLPNGARIRTGLPAVYWRRLYQGTPPAKSQWSQVKEGCGILEAIMELDVEEIRLYGDRDRSFRMSEGIAFAEAMRQKVARTLFYGDSNRNPDEFNGLAMRYPASDAENVLDAGGRDGGCTSLWLVSWGPQSVHGIYPKGSRGGLSHEDLKTYMAQDENGRKYQVTGDKYNWRCGLAVRDWRGVVRIANVPVAALGKRKGEEGFVDLQKLTIEAKNRMPQHLRQKAVWYANADVLTALELQNSDAGQVQLHYGEFFDAKAVPVLHGRPVRQCDAIASDEASI